MIYKAEENDKKRWPKDCIWPEPLAEGEGKPWNIDDAENLQSEHTNNKLVDMKRHDILKIPFPSPVAEIQQIIGYRFVNENLLRQAFTRKAFAEEKGVADSEVLEFLGDTVLNTAVTLEMVQQVTHVEENQPYKSFHSNYDEGELSRIRSRFISQKHLSARALELGLDQYILYGEGEKPSESAMGDMMEAVLGAAAVDSDWDWKQLEALVNRLVAFQISDSLIRPNYYYEIFNAWHQKYFGKMPEYDVRQEMPLRKSRQSDDGNSDGNNENHYGWYCTLRFHVPENDAGVETNLQIDVERETLSKARESAAAEAIQFLMRHSLWLRMGETEEELIMGKSINQLDGWCRKMHKGKPQYEVSDDILGWNCQCVVDSVTGWGNGSSKADAKRKAAFMVLVKLMTAAESSD